MARGLKIYFDLFPQAPALGRMRGLENDGRAIERNEQTADREGGLSLDVRFKSAAPPRAARLR